MLLRHLATSAVFNISSIIIIMLNNNNVQSDNDPNRSSTCCSVRNTTHGFEDHTVNVHWTLGNLGVAIMP